MFFSEWKLINPFVLYLTFVFSFKIYKVNGNKLNYNILTFIILLYGFAFKCILKFFSFSTLKIVLKNIGKNSSRLSVWKIWNKFKVYVIPIELESYKLYYWTTYKRLRL